jgi:hypothetical protein
MPSIQEMYPRYSLLIAMQHEDILDLEIRTSCTTQLKSLLSPRKKLMGTNYMSQDSFFHARSKIRTDVWVSSTVNVENYFRLLQVSWYTDPNNFLSSDEILWYCVRSHENRSCANRSKTHDMPGSGPPSSAFWASPTPQLTKPIACPHMHAHIDTCTLEHGHAH